MPAGCTAQSMHICPTYALCECRRDRSNEREAEDAHLRELYERVAKAPPSSWGYADAGLSQNRRWRVSSSVCVGAGWDVCVCGGTALGGQLHEGERPSAGGPRGSLLSAVLAC